MRSEVLAPNESDPSARDAVRARWKSGGPDGIPMGPPLLSLSFFASRERGFGEWQQSGPKPPIAARITLFQKSGWWSRNPAAAPREPLKRA